MRSIAAVALPVFLSLAVNFAYTVAARAPKAPAPGSPEAVRRAALLHRWAEQRLIDSSVESRQRAVRDLRAAIELDPVNGEHWLLLGTFQLMGEFDTNARLSIERATSLMPNEPRVWIALGRVWKREWLRRLDTLSAARAERAFETACRVRPLASEGWLSLVPMRYERGDLAGALQAADRAMNGRPRRPEATLAAAYLWYRVGEIERADSLFRLSIHKLPLELRALLLDAPSWFRGVMPKRRTRAAPQDALSAPDDPAPMTKLEETTIGDRASRGATMDSAGTFWKRLDPDPTTPENEMQLEYWSRVAHAYFVFYDPSSAILDARAETFVRYGPPSRVENNPSGVPLSYAPIRTGDRRRQSEVSYPMHVQGWTYSELGMRVVLNDQSLHGRFTRQITRDFDPLSVPSPAALAARRDLVAFGDGVAVFPTLPPRDQRLEMRGTVMRFEGERGPRLLAQVQAAGAPGDSLWARWAVLDADGRELAGSRVSLGVSACDPTEWRLAEVVADLPAGAASVTVSVRDGHRRRGLYRAQTTLTPPGSALAMSDVVLCCGDPTMFARLGLVRFEANMDRQVQGRNVSAYFELYRLATSADGLSRFEYEYRVLRFPEPGAKKPRRVEVPTVVSTAREETNAGSLRRQFVNVPIESVPPGRYRLEIRVRDVIGASEVQGATDFERR